MIEFSLGRESVVYNRCCEGREVGVKICFLSTIPFETSRLYTRQCLAVAEAGNCVSLIAPLNVRCEPANFRVTRFHCASGALRKLFCTLQVLLLALNEKADVYHIHSFQLIVCGLVLKKLFQKRIIYDMFEDFPSMALTKRSFPVALRGCFSRTIYCLEKLACKSFDGIVTADPGVIRMYGEKTRVIGKARRRIFFNFPAQWFLKSCDSEHLHSRKSFDVVYSGGLSERTGLLVLLQAVDFMAQAGIRPKVLLFGYADVPSFVSEFHADAVRRGINDCFAILGRVRPFEVPALLCQARVGVVPLQPIPKFLKNIPTKMFEYWGCGLPVVASDLPPIRLFFRNGEFGHLVEPTDACGFARAIARLLVDRKSAERMGEKARDAVRQRMNANSEQRRLLALYSAVVGRQYA